MFIVFIAIGIFVAYLVVFLSIYKQIPPSLSDTYYILESWHKNYGMFFTLMMFTCAFLLLPKMVEVTPDNWKIVAFLCPSAIVFVGAAPRFRLPMESTVHVIAANVAAWSGLAWVAFLTPYWWLIPASVAIIAALALITKTAKSCWTWWLEMVAFLAVFSANILV